MYKYIVIDELQNFDILYIVVLNNVNTIYSIIIVFVQYATNKGGLFVYYDKKETGKRKNSTARIRANAKYSKSHYKNISIKIKPEQAAAIRAKARAYKISIAQLIIRAVDEYKPENISCTEETTEQETAEP